MAEPGQKLPVTDLECLKEAFALFDRDRDGEINTEELGKVGSYKNECHIQGIPGFSVKS